MKAKEIKTIPLTEPIENGKDSIVNELDIRKPDTGDIRGLKIRVGYDNGTLSLDLMTDDLLTLLGRCVAHPPTIINMLSLEDSLAACQVVLGFFGNSRKTGSNG